jgi:hypothetical protein
LSTGDPKIQLGRRSFRFVSALPDTPSLLRGLLPSPAFDTGSINDTDAAPIDTTILSTSTIDTDDIDDTRTTNTDISHIEIDDTNTDPLILAKTDFQPSIPRYPSPLPIPLNSKKWPHTSTWSLDGPS